MKVRNEKMHVEGFPAYNFILTISKLVLTDDTR